MTFSLIVIENGTGHLPFDDTYICASWHLEQITNGLKLVFFYRNFRDNGLGAAVNMHAFVFNKIRHAFSF